MNNRRPVQISRQRGVALVVGLLILFILTLLGISAYNNANVQERSAGNSKLQSQAFEVAAAGASNAINFLKYYQENHAGLLEDENCGATDHEGWVYPTPWLEAETIDGVVLSQRMYCLADEYPCEEGEAGCEAGTMLRPPRSQLFVLSRGRHPSGSDRFVEVRLALGAQGGGAGDGCGALCFPGCETSDLNFPNSNAFRVDGEDGYAVTGGCPSMADDITDAIKNNRIDNYLGGIGSTEPGSPWNDADQVEAFRLNLKEAAIAANDGGTCQTGCYFEPAEGFYEDNGNSNYGSVENPQITYIEGDLHFGGGISGGGILVVNGDLYWNGTPDYKGLIMVLGGTYYIDGGGTGGDHAGSVVILNTFDAPSDSDNEFGPSTFDNTGGGIAEYNYDCAVLKAIHAELLDTAGQEMWNPECNAGPENVFQAGPPEIIIASWRENIGWREAMTAE